MTLLPWNWSSKASGTRRGRPDASARFPTQNQPQKTAQATECVLFLILSCPSNIHGERLSQSSASQVDDSGHMVAYIVKNYNRNTGYQDAGW